MTAHAISFDDWNAAVLWQHVTDAEAAVKEANQHPSGLHPAAAATIHEWLTDMRAAADDRNETEVIRLAVMVRDKLALEREWYG